MRRRTLLTGLGGIAAASALNACGGGDTQQNEAPAEIDENTEATLELAYWDRNQSVTVEALIASFTEKYPRITVTPALTGPSEYWMRLRTQAEGNNLPDVFWMSGLHVQLYASEGLLAPVADDVDFSVFPQAMTDLYTVDGTHYGIPKDFDTIACWVNQRLVEEAGVTLPDPETWTWEEFGETTRAIAAGLGDRGHAVVTDLNIGGQQNWYNTVAQAGGYIIADGRSGYADPNTIRGLEFWSNLVADGVVPHPRVIADNPPQTVFISGRAAIHHTGSWETAAMLADYPDPGELMVVPLPRDQERASTIHGLAYVVAANSPNLAAASALQRHLTSEEAGRTDAANGTAIPAWQGTADKWHEVKPEWNLKVFTDAAENYAVPYPVSRNTAAWNQLEADILTPAFAGDVPMAQAAEQLAQQMDEMLAAER